MQFWYLAHIGEHLTVIDIYYGAFEACYISGDSITFDQESWEEIQLSWFDVGHVYQEIVSRLM